jgi:thiol-disulfide isomerase/thioredoxin
MKYLIFILICLICTVLPLKGQQAGYAPDFGLISEHDDTLYLQEDLLDQGINVVLAFFRPYCVPCEDAVSTLNGIYNDYGQNNGDVYLWAICNELYPYSVLNQFETNNNADYEAWATTEDDSVVQLYEAYAVPKYYVVCHNGFMSEFQLEEISDAVNDCLLLTNNAQSVEKPELVTYPGTVFLRAFDNKKYKVTLYSMSGKLLLHEQATGGTKLPVDLPAGIYLYQITDKQGYRYSGRIFN